MTPQEKAAHRKAARDSYIASKTAPAKVDNKLEWKPVGDGEPIHEGRGTPIKANVVETKAPAKK